MTDTDWREILSFSQKDLKQADKEKLCESLSWMEADDIELNFTDLKTLFRLAQDILKYKSEQVNNLMGQLETSQRKSSKTKSRTFVVDSPGKSSDSVLETIAHQEEVIKANKEILEQLYADIAELENRKNKIEKENDNIDRESESSRDALSEMNAMAQLENEITVKNRHIRKLLADIKVLEEVNAKFKEKVSTLKDKLTEATKLIENFTEQLLTLNNETLHLKEILGKSEESKAQLSAEIESLRKKLYEKDNNTECAYDELKSKIQHWKNIARAKKSDVEKLTNENTKLKERVVKTMQSFPSSSPKKIYIDEQKIKELQDKLSEASNEITQSAKIIDLLKAENKQLKSVIEETPDSVSELKNESDDGKERVIINKLKKKVKMLTVALQEAEEITSVREKELTEITSQLQLVQSEESIKALLEEMKGIKKQLKFKNESIKSLVQEVNTLHQLVDDLQLQNETMREKFNIPKDENIPTEGILKKHHDLEKMYSDLYSEAKEIENKLVAAELENRNLKLKNNQLVNFFNKLSEKDINLLYESSDRNIDSVNEEKSENFQHNAEKENGLDQQELQAIIEENEGLRKGLEDILNFLKDNSTTSSGVLTLECPSLESILRNMEARHAAGWFAPHMATILELRAALGGKDALLTALHEARKETFDIMAQLEKENQKSLKLEQKINEIESTNILRIKKEQTIPKNGNLFEFGPWMSDKEINNIDLLDRAHIENIVAKRNSGYEEQLKMSLSYFHERYTILFDKITSITIQASDELNKWSIQEEQYNAEIENLKAQLFAKDAEDISDDSPGLIEIPSANFLQRKCSFLENSYKYIRTLNENMKNDMLQSKKDMLMLTSEFELKTKKLMLSVVDLSDKLRSSIPLDLFWKQNSVLNETVTKYRKVIDGFIKKNDETQHLLKTFEENKFDILNTLQRDVANFLQNENKNNPASMQVIINNLEESITQKHLQQLCAEIENKGKQIENLDAQNIKLQELQGNIIDETLASITKQEIDLMRVNLQKVTDENKILKEQCQHVESQLNIALVQLEDIQHRQLTNDMETNILRHQILDLQSTSDNKAILAKLGGELLVAHLQASEGLNQIQRLNTALKYEKQLKAETEEMLNARQKIFDVYSFRYETKFRYMYEVMQILRQQYQGSTPTASIENYLNNIENLSRKTHAANEKLFEIEDLQSRLMMKHAIFEQVMDLSKNKCINDEDSCPHKLKMIIEEGLRCRESEYFKKKIKTLEQSREELLVQYNKLEKTLVLVNQGFEKSNFKESVIKKTSSDSDINPNLEMEDIHSDDDGNTKRSQTFSLKQPKLLKTPKDNDDMTMPNCLIDDKSNAKLENAINISENKPEVCNIFTQTSLLETRSGKMKSTQTDEDQTLIKLRHHTSNLTKDIDTKNKELAESMSLAQKRAEDILSLHAQKSYLDARIQNLKESNATKDRQIKKLQSTIENLKRQLDDCKTIAENDKTKDETDDENKYILLLKQLEMDKNAIVTEYKELLKTEREEYSKSIKDFNMKVMELQSQLDSRGNDSDSLSAEAQKEAILKYTMKIRYLEDKCFKLQSELDGRKTELSTYQNEVKRWKNLATERLVKMEQLNSQLEQRHCHELESYKAENQHWLSQLTDTQREHMELRTRITEQKTLHIKQLADKDVQIEQLRTIIHNLKAQIMNMQTMISINDPSFDLSAIVEAEETSDEQGSDRLELRFDSTVDFHDMPDDSVKFPTSSTTIWQEPLIDRLRREKHLIGKQNLILRRQIKALAARERRARLDAQNLKSQVFRINSSGGKAVSSETVGLHNKIAALQSQLTSARKDTQSSISLWDKWKRSQQSAERWQARYEEKFQETKKLESNLNLAKSAVARLEKEKRVLLHRLSEVKNESMIAIEKQESEALEKSLQPHHDCACSSPPPVSTRALLERVQAQQRRIVALEVAEKGNEHLVSEYEKASAEITSLKGQVLKLESTLLESQIRSPLKSAAPDPQPEVDYWKSYCEMLKEENVQLTLRVNALETTPATTHQQRVNDLEQTVLTLRGLVSKLQAEQKSFSTLKRVDSRPSSGRSVSDKGRSQSESLRIEIANLKRSIMDKDLLLEKSKEMLKIAAEREEQLLRENAFLRQRINELTTTREGFLSV